MILVLYGTREARELIAMLTDMGYEILAAASTKYGCSLAGTGGAAEVITVPESGETDVSSLSGRSIDLVIDATHPFTNSLSQWARSACTKLSIPYIRFERLETELPRDPMVHSVYSWAEAAQLAAGLGNTVFLTTGSNNLDIFVNHPEMQGKRLVVRVLPESRIIQKCQDIGLSPRDIVAMHGPFSVKFNKAIFQAYRADVIVTRDSGPASGTDTKIKAALSLKIPVVVIRRNAAVNGARVHTYQQVLEMVNKELGPPIKPK